MSEREIKKGDPRVLRCDEWEDMLADALDGTLAPADAAAFARHHSDCALCAQMLKENQQGRAWMEYLAVEPEVPAGLLQKILARTSDPSAVGVAQPTQAIPALPAWHRVSLPLVSQIARQLPRHLFEPRLMMTVAMAFFSIALTLNLTGVNLSQVRAADLQPSRLRVTLTRQYYSTNQQVTKYYENLRLVYEMEARVRELRRSTEAEPASGQAPQPSPKPAPRAPARDGSGSPSSKVPRDQPIIPAPGGTRSSGKSEGDAPAMMVQASPRNLPTPRTSEHLTATPASFDPFPSRRKVKREVFRSSRSHAEDLTERSLV